MYRAHHRANQPFDMATIARCAWRPMREFNLIIRTSTLKSTGVEFRDLLPENWSI